MYALTMLSNPRARMNKFVIGVSSLVKRERHMTMLLKEIDISRIMVYAQ